MERSDFRTQPQIDLWLLSRFPHWFNDTILVAYSTACVIHWLLTLARSFVGTLVTVTF